jgi:hypothetical protein
VTAAAKSTFLSIRNSVRLLGDAGSPRGSVVQQPAFHGCSALRHEPQKRQTREWISVLSRVAALLGDLLSLAWGF